MYEIFDDGQSLDHSSVLLEQFLGDFTKSLGLLWWLGDVDRFTLEQQPFTGQGSQ